MRLPRRTLLASILISALLTAGCGGMISTLNDLSVVQNELAKKFGEEVTVNANSVDQGVVFVVWFINSPLNDQTAGAREKRADEAAQVVKASYSGMQNVRELWVGFLRKQTRFVVFHHSQIVAMHAFNKDAQRIAGRSDDRARAPSNAQVTASYISSDDVTDISVSGIQLEGNPGGLGLTVLPFFKVAGDVRAGNGPPPATVSLNFASYAEKPKFAQTVPIRFIVDGKEVLKAEGAFTGKDAQFCYLHLPYRAFATITSGRTLVMKLGDKEYPLTPSQLEAMRAMTDYVAK